MNKRKSTAGVIIVSAIAVCALIVALNSASCRRLWKSFSSNVGNGLERTVTLYDYNGNVIKQYSGKFDVTSSETETFFDIDGKRVIIHGGIIVNEEK